MRPDAILAAALLLPLLLAGCHPDYSGALACEGPARPVTASSAYAGRTIAELEALAGDGDLAAARVLGERYQHGEGVSVDLKQAVRWYEQAAIIPPPTMMVYMPGYGHVAGTVLPVTAGPATPGDPVAMAHLGWLYVDGAFLPFDEDRGRELLSCAELRGVRLSLISPTQHNFLAAATTGIARRETGKADLHG
jgi:TPR repeat protein